MRDYDAERWTSVYCRIRLNFDCNYTFTFDLAPTRIQFGEKSIAKL